MISVINSDTKSVLEKLKVSQTGGDQFGNYTCFANNSIGSVSAMVSYSGNVMYNVGFNTSVSIGDSDTCNNSLVTNLSLSCPRGYRHRQENRRINIKYMRPIFRSPSTLTVQNQLHQHISGCPEPPTVTSKSVSNTTRTYNVSWTCVSFSRILEYEIAYKNKWSKVC